MAQVFKSNLYELYGRRFDPAFVWFLRRQLHFHYPARSLGSMLSAPPEYGAAEAGVEREKDSQIRYVRITDIDEHGELLPTLGATVDNAEPQYLLEDGDLLFARSGNTAGKCYIHEAMRVDYPCLYAGYMIRFRFDVTVLPKYVFAFAQTPYYHDWVMAVRRAAGQPNINAQEYSDLKIPLPPLPVQRKIVAELDAAYAAKRKADQEAASLLASIDDMVLDELGIAKLPPRDTSLSSRIFIVPLKEVVEDRLDAIAYQRRRTEFYRNVRNGQYGAEELGSLVDVCREQTDDMADQTYVGLENINPEDGSYFGSEEKDACSSAMVFSKGQILFPKLRPYLNKVWLAEFDGVASTEFVPLQATGVLAEYLTVFLRMGIVAETMGVLMTGNTLPRVQPKDILSLPIPVPPKSVQERIARRAIEIKAKAKELKSTAATNLAIAKRRIEAELMGEGGKTITTKRNM